MHKVITKKIALVCFMLAIIGCLVMTAVMLGDSKQNISVSASSVPPGYQLAGAGTTGNPYQIRNRTDLDFMALVLSSDASAETHQFFYGHYRVMNNIDMGGNRNPWLTPIGGNRDANFFRGTFDGGNNTISNLWYHDEVRDIALFSTLGQEAIIRNLILNNVDIYMPHGREKELRVGGLAIIGQGATIENVSVSANITIQTPEAIQSIYVGGIFAEVYTPVVINYCTVLGELTTYGTTPVLASNVYVGGFVGRTENSITITNSSTRANVKASTSEDGGSAYAAGLVGLVCGGGSIIEGNYGAYTESQTVRKEILAIKTNSLSGGAYASGLINSLNRFQTVRYNAVGMQYVAARHYGVSILPSLAPTTVGVVSIFCTTVGVSGAITFSNNSAFATQQGETTLAGIFAAGTRYNDGTNVSTTNLSYFYQNFGWNTDKWALRGTTTNGILVIIPNGDIQAPPTQVTSYTVTIPQNVTGYTFSNPSHTSISSTISSRFTFDLTIGASYWDAAPEITHPNIRTISVVRMGSRTFRYTATHTMANINNLYVLSPPNAEMAFLSYSFNSDGGTTVTGSPSHRYGTTIPKPPNPTRDGFVFVGWFRDLAVNQPWDFENDVLTSHLVLHAKWATFAWSQQSETKTIKYGSPWEWVPAHAAVVPATTINYSIVPSSGLVSGTHFVQGDDGNFTWGFITQTHLVPGTYVFEMTASVHGEHLTRTFTLIVEPNLTWAIDNNTTLTVPYRNQWSWTPTSAVVAPTAPITYTVVPPAGLVSETHFVRNSQGHIYWGYMNQTHLMPGTYVFEVTASSGGVQIKKTLTLIITKASQTAPTPSSFNVTNFSVNGEATITFTFTSVTNVQYRTLNGAWQSSNVLVVPQYNETTAYRFFVRYAETETHTASPEVELTPRTVKTLVLNHNFGDTPTKVSVKVRDGTDYNLHAWNPTREGFRFDGWSMSDPTTHISRMGTWQSDWELELFAKWSPNPIVWSQANAAPSPYDYGSTWSWTPATATCLDAVVSYELVSTTAPAGRYVFDTSNGRVTNGATALAVGTYTFSIRAVATNGAASATPRILTINIRKLNTTTNASFNVLSYGNVVQLDNMGAGWEYSINGGAFSTTRTFNGLPINVQHVFRARIAETPTHNASNELTATLTMRQITLNYSNPASTTTTQIVAEGRPFAFTGLVPTNYNAGGTHTFMGWYADTGFATQRQSGVWNAGWTNYNVYARWSLNSITWTESNATINRVYGESWNWSPDSAKLPTGGTLSFRVAAEVSSSAFTFNTSTGALTPNSNLSPGVYVFNISAIINDGSSAEESAPISITLTITKASQTASGTLEVELFSLSSITLSNRGALYEYSVDGVNWSSNRLFNGLSLATGTTHTFYARLAETDTHFASANRITTTLRMNTIILHYNNLDGCSDEVIVADGKGFAFASLLSSDYNAYGTHTFVGWFADNGTYLTERESGIWNSGWSNYYVYAKWSMNPVVWTESNTTINRAYGDTATWSPDVAKLPAGGELSFRVEVSGLVLGTHYNFDAENGGLNILDNINPNTYEFSIYAIVNDGSEEKESNSITITLTIVKAANTSNPVEVVPSSYAGNNGTAVTSIVLTSNSDYEYSLNGIDGWSSESTFIGVFDVGTHTFYVRYKATETHNASSGIAVLAVVKQITLNHGYGIGTTTVIVINGVEYFFAPISREHFTFIGWFEQGTDNQFESGVWADTSPTTLLARWVSDCCAQDPCICDEEDVCEICEEDPCICGEDTTCVICEQDPCVCEQGTTCDICDQDPCICDDVCDVCNQDPCICADVCAVCGQDPCICGGEEVCEICEQDPCICEEDTTCGVCEQDPCICVEDNNCEVCDKDPCECKENPSVLLWISFGIAGVGALAALILFIWVYRKRRQIREA